MSLGTLGVLLVTLKCADVIDWSWWVVLIPFWFILTFVALEVWKDKK